MSRHMCPEKRLEVVLDYYDSGVQLIQYASTCFVSIPSLRKWIKDFNAMGFEGLCTEEEWSERQQMVESGKYSLDHFHCCQGYKFSKVALHFFENPGMYKVANRMSR